MKGLAKREGSRPEDICLSCGLCCNGVIFGDVKLLPQEDPQRLLSLGLPLLRAGRKTAAPARRGWRFVQPCAAFDGCRCRIYPSRPSHCLNFECLVLKDLQSGAINRAEALRVIRRARRQAEQVDKLLQDLGDTDSGLSLRERFRRTTKRLERLDLDSQTAGQFGKLTVAFHELNLTLQVRFYPDAT